MHLRRLLCLAAALGLVLGCEASEDLVDSAVSQAGGSAQDLVDDANDLVDALTTSSVSGQVVNLSGEPVEGVTIKLYDLTDNTDFVTGADIESGEGFIDPSKVISSDNTTAVGTTDADGRFEIDAGTAPFLATASKDGCTNDFAGFDADTGVLSLETLIVPMLTDEMTVFEAGTFTVVCAEAPSELNDDGSAASVTPLEPEPEPAPTCDSTSCGEGGGFCANLEDGTSCSGDDATCEVDATASNLFINATCLAPACSDMVACEGELLCQNAGLFNAACVSPTCTADVDCDDGRLCRDANTLSAACIAPACGDDAGCGVGEICENEGTLDARCLAIPCNAEGEGCADGTYCIGGGTIAAVCQSPACADDADCDLGDLCNINPDEPLGNVCFTPVCITDNDCSNETPICNNPETVLATCVAAQCTVGSCGAGQYCRDASTPASAQCVPFVCSSDADCAGASNNCLQGGTPQATCAEAVCSETVACPDDHYCVNGGTVEAQCMPVHCEADQPCIPGVPLTAVDCTVSDDADAETGICADVAACAGINGTSTAGRCPGAANIQCCTFDAAASICANADVPAEAMCTMLACSGNSCGNDALCANEGTLAATCVDVVCRDESADGAADGIACENAGDICVDGGLMTARCVTPACADDAGCADGKLCADAGTLAAACIDPTCRDAGETAMAILCPEGELCANGGTFEAVCRAPACSAGDCADGLVCANPGTLDAACIEPACVTDDDCEGAHYCGLSELTGLPECQEPDPNEILAPEMPASSWTVFKIQNLMGDDLSDATTENQQISQDIVDANELVNIYAEFSGEQTSVYAMVQTGGSGCGDDMEPKTDYIEIPVVDGKLDGGDGAFMELYLYGGFMKLQLSTSNVNGEGDRTNIVEFGDSCHQPENPLTVILSWERPEDNPNARIDLDLHVWNAEGGHGYYGRRVQEWGSLNVDDRKGPGPEVFTVTPAGADKGPYTVKVRYFSGRSAPQNAKIRIIHWDGTMLHDRSYGFELERARTVAEIGVFSVQAEPVSAEESAGGSEAGTDDVGGSENAGDDGDMGGESAAGGTAAE